MSLNIMDLSLFRFRAEQHTIEPEHTIILSLLDTLNLPVTPTPIEALTTARDLISDYVTADARRVLAMIDAALAAPAPVPGMETTDWLVYSREHNAFWRPERCGYTRHVEAAGRYSRVEAGSLCDDAALGRGRHGDREVPEFMIPAPEAFDRLTAKVTHITTERDAARADRERWKAVTKACSEERMKDRSEVSRLTGELAEARAFIVHARETTADVMARREIAARESERERCAKIAAADKMPDCGLPRDYPVDKPCPQCGDLGTVGGFAGKCPGSAGNRIATTIRSQS